MACRLTASVDDITEEARNKRRRPHRKAKTGCTDCRRRRVKCSEEKPNCRACVRRSVQCHYSEDCPVPCAQLVPSSTPDEEVLLQTPSAGQADQPHDSPQSSLPPFSVPTTATSVSGLLSGPTITFESHDVALLHHWTISTSLTIFTASDTSVCWQVIFPQLAFEHPFVMYAILSLASLHLAYLSLDRADKNRYMTEAVRYHNRALRGFHEAVSVVGTDNGDALFAWSSLNILYVFGVSGQLGEDVEDGPEPHCRSRKDRMLGVEWIPMVRGVQAVLEPARTTLELGRLRRLMTYGNWWELDPDDVPDPSDECFRQIQRAWEGSVDAPTYDEALRVLRKCRLFIAQFDTMDAEVLKNWGFNRAWAGPFMFVYFGPREFFTLLEQRQPPALIVFAYFGGLLHTLNYCWLLEGWGRGIVEEIDDLLGSYWRPWIAWPAKAVGLI